MPTPTRWPATRRRREVAARGRGAGHRLHRTAGSICPAGPGAGDRGRGAEDVSGVVRGSVASGRGPSRPLGDPGPSGHGAPRRGRPRGADARVAPGVQRRPRRRAPPVDRGLRPGAGVDPVRPRRPREPRHVASPRAGGAARPGILRGDHHAVRRAGTALRGRWPHDVGAGASPRRPRPRPQHGVSGRRRRRSRPARGGRVPLHGRGDDDAEDRHVHGAIRGRPGRRNTVSSGSGPTDGWKRPPFSCRARRPSTSRRPARHRAEKAGTGDAGPASRPRRSPVRDHPPPGRGRSS